MSKSELVVRAIDVGYGNVKYSESNIDRATGQLSISKFPSVAVPVSPNHIHSDLLAKRDTVITPVGDTLFEVGVDSLLANSTRSNRTLHEDYVNDPNYEALMKGALAYMGVDHIDVLILGLPVKLFDLRKDVLKQKWTGEHVVSVDSNGTERTVTVANVGVLMQPAGVLVDVSAREFGGIGQMKDLRLLCLDGGFYSFDWFASQGLKPIQDRCGGNDLGANKILRAIGDAAGKDLEKNITNLNQIDEAVRGGHFAFGQRQVPVDPYLSAADALVGECMNDLMSSIKNGDDFGHVILAGGSGFMFEKAVRARFPDHEVVVVPDAIYSVLRGFQVAGEQQAAKLSRPQAAA